VALTLGLPQRPLEWSWWGAVLLLIASRVAEAGIVEITRESDEAGYGVSLATVPQLACALLLPAPIACLVSGATMLIDEFTSRSPVSRLAFNVASTTLSVGLTSIGAGLLGISGAGLAETGWSGVASFLLVAACYYLVNTLPVAWVGALAGGRPVWPAILQSARSTAVVEFAFALLGGLVAFVWVVNPYWLLVGVAPVIISQLALRYVAERNRKTEQLSSLDRLGQQLSLGPTAEEIFQAVSSEMCGVRSVEGCFLTLPDNPALFSNGLAGGEPELMLARRLASQVKASGRSLWLQDASMEFPEVHGHARTWLVLPLGRAEDGLAVLGLTGRERNAFADHDREFFALVAERVSLALEGARRSAELTRMAFHDALTGLPNRELLAQRLEHALRLSTSCETSAALLFLDLDRFKEINDTFGHRYGDLVLQELGRRLAAELPAAATLARLAGDEFAVLLPDADTMEASRVAENLLRVLARTVQVHDVTLDVGASIGIAVASDQTTEADILLRQADVAMYVAKRRRGGYEVYSPDQDTHSRARLELAADLRGVIERGELRLHYQPIVSLETGRMDEVEALVRWDHPQRGLVSPAQFIPLAEETGMIIPIGRWVIEEACRQAVTWREQFISARSLTMSVNLSPRQFQHTDLPAEISEIIRITGMDPRSLKLEITESIAMADTELNIAALWLLKGMGLRLAIDDFGTGYSSLGYLKRFPVETLKIDKGFVDGLGIHPEDGAVIAAIIAFAKAVGLSTTAEGVEDAEQLARLREMGADRVQGYYCSRPVPPEKLEELLLTRDPLLQKGLHPSAASGQVIAIDPERREQSQRVA